ncbi:hypothetical protein BGZ58_003056 [Dissophora ornata]|nr:hypothetical protein BGZ58_003056 [Dissophora ornata]
MTPELILYLEPTKSTTLWTQVHEFFALSRNQPWSNNEALRYPAHITMVGFFDDLTGPDPLIRFLDQQIPQINKNDNPPAVRTMPVSESTFIQGLIRPHPTSLLLAVKPSPQLLDLMQTWTEAFPELKLRLKRINHLSLCYWTDEQEVLEGKISLEDMQQRVAWTDQAMQRAQEKISMLDTTTTATNITDERVRENPAPTPMPTPPPADTWALNESWDIVLYSIQNRDKTDHRPHPLVELHRWTLA